VTDEFMLEFLQNHTNLIKQHSFDNPLYSGINPYTLGFSMYCDIERICKNPTDEDKRWFPDLVSQNWLDALHHAMQSFKDESFISQYLSPKVIRDLRLFTLLDDEKNDYFKISAIHDEAGYQHIRDVLSSQYNIGDNEPNIQVFSVDVRGTRALTLRHYQHQGKPLANTVHDVLKHFYFLWGFPVILEVLDESGKVIKSFECPSSSKEEQKPPTDTTNVSLTP
jgi:spore cortex formation protein SpoVR/YcgB (stage V sporulation)